MNPLGIVVMASSPQNLMKQALLDECLSEFLRRRVFGRTDAEQLLDLDRVVEPSSNGLIRVPAHWDADGSQIANLALATAFVEQRPVFRLRAIVEDWDWQRLIREMY